MLAWNAVREKLEPRVRTAIRRADRAVRVYLLAPMVFGFAAAAITIVSVKDAIDAARRPRR